jgi:glycosyltransferase involved in cell wall biosynthesis
VIYPPVDCDFFTPSPAPDKDGDYFLMVTAMAPYKRVHLAVEAFNRLGKPLLIVGDGQGFKPLKRAAKRNVEFLGWQSDEKVRDYYRECKAFIFPGEEDFGIAPVEVQACGRPVIAYGRGGVLETVVPLSEERATGVFFNQPTVESLTEAVEVFERKRDRLDSREIRKNALRFQKSNFREKIKAFIDEKYQEFEELKAQGSKPRTKD